MNMRPYPTLPPAKQKKPVCVVPFPTSCKRAVPTSFNAREYWSWGAKIQGNNCCPLKTLCSSP